jgi:hypothetical protein
LVLAVIKGGKLSNPSHPEVLEVQRRYFLLAALEPGFQVKCLREIVNRDQEVIEQTSQPKNVA